MGSRQNWLDDDSQSSMIDEYAQQLSSFVEALADGKLIGTDSHEQRMA